MVKLSPSEILFAQSNSLMLTRLAQWHDAEVDRAKRETKPEHVAWHTARAKELRDEVARLTA